MQHTTENRADPWLVCGRVFFTFCLAATIVFIFSNSRQVAGVSDGRSLSALARAQTFLTQMGLPELANRLTNHIIRKMGHFLEYTLEGFWLMLCLRVYTRHFIKHISWPLLGGLLTALCDESIQLFTAGRSGQITDVWLDFSGVVCGLLAGFLVLCLFRMFSILRHHRREEY